MATIVDTTVLVNALLKVGSEGVASRAFLQREADTRLPAYAIKELKAGALHYYVWFHNKTVEAATWAEAVDAIRRVRQMPNRSATAMQALTEFLSSVANEMPDELRRRYPGLTVDGAKKEEMRLWLKQRILRAWKRRRQVTSSVIGALACYNEAAPIVLQSGQIDDHPTVCSVPDCCLRERFAARTKDLRALEQASRGPRPEHSKRSKALHEMARNPKRAFPPKSCVHLGDAVFTLECSPGDQVATTNVRDHQPLADALGVGLVNP
jgi:hypothetical protein